MTLLQRIFGREKNKPQLYAEEVEPFFKALGVDIGDICPDIRAARESPTYKPIIYFDSLNATPKKMGEQVRIVITGNYEVTPRTFVDGRRLQEIGDAVRGSFKVIDGKLAYSGGNK